MRVAFYAPLKAPSHATPSGDRRMAELLMAALEAADCEVELASQFRSYEGAGDAARQRALKLAGEAEAARLSAAYKDMPPALRPEAWFTYHLYHKAPDWLGPALSRELGIPYLVAEAAHAPKQADGPWALGHAAAGRAITEARAVFCLTSLDAACVAPLLGAGARLFLLPPFLDSRPFAAAPERRHPARAALAATCGLDPSKHWLLSVAMMREGDKLASYRELGRALSTLASEDWQLLVVGHGPARPAAEKALSALGPGRVVFAGSQPQGALPDVYAACDLCVWPAVGEAYGMVLLEAQAAGLPVIAGNVRGVPEVVQDGVTGLLAPAGDAAALAALVRRVLADGELRARLSRQARAFVTGERSLEHARRILQGALDWARAPRAGVPA